MLFRSFGAAPQPDRSSSRAAIRSILAVEQASSPMQPGRSQAEALTIPRPQALSIWRPIKARPNTISAKVHPVGLRPLRCRGQRATQDRQGLLEQPEQLDRLVLKEIRARPALPARRAQPEQQAPQDRPAQRAQREQLAQRAPRAMSALAYSSGRALRLQAQQTTTSGS